MYFDLRRIHQNMHRLHREDALFMIMNLMNLSPDMTCDDPCRAPCLVAKKGVFHTFATV